MGAARHIPITAPYETLPPPGATAESILTNGAGLAIILCCCAGPALPVQLDIPTGRRRARANADFFPEVPVYAIFESGGRQYRAERGHSFSVEKLPVEVGDQIEFDNVLLVAESDQVAVGAPYLPGALVKATVVEQYRGKKIFIWKYKSKKRYRRRAGHRQYYTRLRIDQVIFADIVAAEEEE